MPLTYLRYCQQWAIGHQFHRKALIFSFRYIWAQTIPATYILVLIELDWAAGPQPNQAGSLSRFRSVSSSLRLLIQFGTLHQVSTPSLFFPKLCPVSASKVPSGLTFNWPATMASTSSPCIKPNTVATAARIPSQPPDSAQPQRLSFPIVSPPSLSLSLRPTFSGFQWPSRKQSSVTKVHAQANKLSAEESSNSIPPADSKPEGRIPDSATVAECMAQVADLVKLVDSRDIVELKLKQLDCEIEIRKKEALPQPPAPAASPFMMMQTPYPQAMPPQPAAAPSAPAAASASSVPALPPPAAKPASSHHQLKCPMAGTFYRSPAPGEPAFVKVGDKVQKGQVLCIIEAMKLMNEIEADQSGTITEILVDDGKPVSVDLPLFAIAP
ncbi:unnamed protein product [Linum tenue]|uniref:Lipoyl-binding domain-containing protein n=1 Tax=Linum tenue TaxID=586396 RepID=A0AAV0N7K3_9ROSI|nr:unnamed protein product [Linum tenue]